jgi:hypothetical protein
MTPLEKFFVDARLEFAWKIASSLSSDHATVPMSACPAIDKCTTADLLERLLPDRDVVEGPLSVWLRHRYRPINTLRLAFRTASVG